MNKKSINPTTDKNEKSVPQQIQMTISTENSLEKGITLFNNDQYIEAIEYFSQILATEENPLARQYLARCYFRLDKFDVAYRHYQVLTQFKEHNNYALTMMATIKGLKGNYDEAIKLLCELPKINTTRINLSILYWLKFKEEGKPSFLDKAFEELKPLDIKTTPPQFLWRTYLTLGSCYQSAKKYSTAKLYYNRALKSTDNLNVKAKILDEYATLYMELGQLGTAEKMLDIAHRYNHKNNMINIDYNSKYRKQLEKLKKELAEKKSLELQEKLKKGIRFFEESNYIEAIEIFSMILGEEKNDLAQQYLARCYFQMDKYEEAYKHFALLSSSEKYRDYAISMLATISAIQGNHSEAIKILKKLPNTINNTINLSVFYLLKHLENGEEWLLLEAKKLLKSLHVEGIDPKFHWRIHVTFAEILQAEKAYKLAKSKYILALKAAPNSIIRGIILNDFGMYHIQTGDLDKAEKILDKAILLLKDKSTLEEGYNAKYRGLIEKKKRNYEKAKEFLQIAANKFKERNLFKELAEVYHMLVELHNPSYKFYEMADNYAKAVYYEKKQEEVNAENAKILDHVINSFNGIRNNI